MVSFCFWRGGTLGLQVADAAFHRQPEWRTSAVTRGNPFFPVHLQNIVDVQRLECPRGQDLGLYVVGLDAAGKLAYEWLGMEQLIATIFGVPPGLVPTEEPPYGITIKAMPALVEQTRSPEMTESRGELLKIGLLAVGSISRTVLNDLALSLPCIHRTIAINIEADPLLQVKVDREIAVRDATAPNFNVHFAQDLAQSAIAEITNAVAGLDMVLLVAEMGDGASVGIAPLVAQVLHQQNTLTLAVAILPFEFEGSRCQNLAQFGLSTLRKEVHALLPISKNDIPDDQSETAESAFTYVRFAFIQLCRSITNTVVSQSTNVGIMFKDLRSLIQDQVESSAFGFGFGSSNQVGVAVQQAIDHPFLGLPRLQQASAALVAIEAAPHALFLKDTKNILSQVRSHLPAEATIGYSIVFTQPQKDCVFRVSILTSGISFSS